MSTNRSKKYVKKPPVIDAIQLDGRIDTLTIIQDWIGNGPEADYTKTQCPIYIHTPEGTTKAVIGDWIIKGIVGEIYPCKPDIFFKTYMEQEE